MADGDVVISLPAVTAAPLEYDVKQAEWFAIKQVQALYTDNGAAGAWLPTLELVAPGGIVTGRYVGTSVAAGDGQEVTFYPLGSKGASAAPVATGGLPSATMVKANTQTIAGNSVSQVSLSTGTFATTDGAIFTASGSNVVIHATGLYAAYIHFVDDNTATDPTTTEFFPKWLGATLGANAPWQQIVPRMFNVNGPAGLQGGDPVGGGLVDSIANISVAYVSELNGTVGAWMATLSASAIQTSTCLLTVVQLQPIDATTLAGFPSYPF